MIAAHRSRTMPVWGERFKEIYDAKGSKEGEFSDRIAKIVVYLNSIQDLPQRDSLSALP